MQYGKITVLEKAPEKSMFFGQCECGNIKKFNIYNLKKGTTKSCGCSRKERMREVAKVRFKGVKPANFVDYSGKKIGMITVLERVDDVRKHCTTYKCQCECGTTSNIELSNLRKGQYKICKCGPAKHPLRDILSSMIDRCEIKNNSAYRYYGARGITVCEEWKKYPIKFIEWATKNGWYKSKGEERKKRISIDRIDSNKGYCPENCHWITISENSKKAMKKRWQNEKP